MTALDDMTARYTAGMASAEDVLQLNAALAADAAARYRFLRFCNLDSALAVEAVEAGDGVVAPMLRTRPSWRSAAAAMVAAMCGAVLGAGVALAVVPSAREEARRVILRSGFERADEVVLRAGGPIPPGPVPGYLGAWQADMVRPTGAERGVVPFAGRRMLAFEQALGAARFDSGTPRACDLYQFVDLGPLHEEIAAGAASLTVSARFLDASRSQDGSTLFELRIHIFSQPPEEVADFSSSRSALASNVLRTSGHDSDHGWRKLVASTTVPSDAVFAVVQVSAVRPPEVVRSEPAVFGSHYCDDIELTFTPSANSGR